MKLYSKVQQYQKVYQEQDFLTIQASSFGTVVRDVQYSLFLQYLLISLVFISFFSIHHLPQYSSYVFRRAQPKRVKQSRKKVKQSRSKVKQPRKKVKQSRKKVKQPRRKVKQPRSKLKQPRSKVQQPRSKVKQPRSKVKQPRSKVKQPWGNFFAPSAHSILFGNRV